MDLIRNDVRSVKMAAMVVGVKFIWATIGGKFSNDDISAKIEDIKL